jgi:hypothetical protein
MNKTVQDLKREMETINKKPNDAILEKGSLKQSSRTTDIHITNENRRWERESQV